MFKRIIRSKVFGIVMFLAVVAGVGFLGYSKYQSDQIAAKAPVSHVTVLTADNFKTVLSGGKPVLMVFCTPDVCKMEQSQLEALAVSANGAIEVATVDVTTQAALAKAVLTQVTTAAGKNIPVAFPLYVLIDDQGSLSNVTIGMMSAQSLQQFIVTSLTAAPATAPSTTTPGTNPTPSTTVPPTK